MDESTEGRPAGGWPAVDDTPDYGRSIGEDERAEEAAEEEAEESPPDEEAGDSADSDRE